MQSDYKELFQMAQAGDTAAVGRLLEFYRTYLALLARVQIGRRLQARIDSSDLVQEAFLAACDHFADFRGRSEGELLTWLRRILASKIADLVRQHTAAKRDIRLERQLARDIDRSSADLANLFLSPRSSPSQELVRREQAVLLADALETLPTDYRDVLILRHLEGLRFEEVAERMHRSIDSVKSLWTRALAKLRQSTHMNSQR